MNTKQKGNFAELRIASRLAELGYTVSFPYGDAARYDLIYQVSDFGGFYTAQCKHGRLRNGCVKFSTVSTNKYSPNKSYEYLVDKFLVFCPETNQVYSLWARNLPAGVVHLRVEPTKNNQASKVLWAKNYVI